MNWLARIILVVAGLGVMVYGLSTYIQSDPFFMAVVIAVIIFGPVMAYEYGASAGREHEKQTWERVMSYFSISGGKGGPKIVNQQELPRAIVVNGAKIKPRVDYKKIIGDMIGLGYPTFTRDSLRIAGAYVGANENYTVATSWLTENKLLTRIMKDGAEVYSWTKGKDQLKSWWSNEDFDELNDE